MKPWLFFDWNGTILDDVNLCLDIHNQVRQKYRKPIYSFTEYQNRFNFPIIDFFVSEEFPPELSFDDYQDVFISQYKNRFSETSIRQGWFEVLKQLKEKFCIGVISAHHTEHLKSDMAFMNIMSIFDCIEGASETLFKKDELISNYIHRNPDQNILLYIGDSRQDYLAAIDNNLPFLGVSWGYHPPGFCNSMIDEPQEMISFLEKQGWI